MELTKEIIDTINAKLYKDLGDSEQGIYLQPYMIPNNVKGLVLYQRYETGGVSGGSCWDSSNPQPYYNRDSMPPFKVLDETLRVIAPTLTYLQYKEIEELIVSSEETEYEYYGNCTEYQIKYVEVDSLMRMLNHFKI